MWVRPCQPNYKPEIKIEIKIKTEANKGGVGVVDHPSAIACTGHRRSRAILGCDKRHVLLVLVLVLVLVRAHFLSLAIPNQTYLR